MESRPQRVLRSPQQKREEAGRHPTTASAEGFHQEKKPLKGQKKLRRLQRNKALADLSDERDMGMDQDGESRMKGIRVDGTLLTPLLPKVRESRTLRQAVRQVARRSFARRTQQRKTEVSCASTTQERILGPAWSVRGEARTTANNPARTRIHGE